MPNLMAESWGGSWKGRHLREQTAGGPTARASTLSPCLHHLLGDLSATCPSGSPSGSPSCPRSEATLSSPSSITHCM